MEIGPSIIKELLHTCGISESSCCSVELLLPALVNETGSSCCFCCTQVTMDLSLLLPVVAAELAEAMSLMSLLSSESSAARAKPLPIFSILSYHDLGLPEIMKSIV